MQECFASTIRTTYEWVIKDLTSDLGFLYENLRKGYNLSSTYCLPNNNYKLPLRFFLESERVQNKESSTLILRCDNISLAKNLKLSFYILNYKRTKCCKFSVLITPQSARENSYKFCKISHLTRDATIFLPNNTLTLGCDLTVYEDGITKVITYEYKPQCPIVCQFKELLENQTFSDFTFEVGNQEFKAHKNILIARSPVFKAMFESEMIETKDNRVKIKNISPEIFKMMLEFIYTDQVEANLTKDNAIKLFVAADKYQLEDLKGICEKNIHDLLNIKNAVEILIFAEQYKMEQLITNAETLMEIYPAQVLDSVIPLLKNHSNCQIFD